MQTWKRCSAPVAYCCLAYYGDVAYRCMDQVLHGVSPATAATWSCKVHHSCAGLCSSVEQLLADPAALHALCLTR
jgi:hypothetical protein